MLGGRSYAANRVDNLGTPLYSADSSYTNMISITDIVSLISG